MIVNGDLQPGAKLAEERMRAQLEVSRSTLREGLQLLVRERLVIHILSTGFFVRRLGRDDIADLMTTREIIECGALFAVPTVASDGLSRVRADRKSTRLNSSHVAISHAVFCLKKKKERCRLHRAATERHSRFHGSWSSVGQTPVL